MEEEELANIGSFCLTPFSSSSGYLHSAAPNTTSAGVNKRETYLDLRSCRRGSVRGESLSSDNSTDGF